MFEHPHIAGVTVARFVRTQAVRARRSLTLPGMGMTLLTPSNSLPSLHSTILKSNCDAMTAVEIIEEIKRLPPAEQSAVVEFARHVGESRPLSPEELGHLARRMVEAKDPMEADRLQQEIVRGFYGR